MNNRINTLYGFISDFWKIIKKYAELPQDQVGWDQLTDEASALYKKHKGTDETPESTFFRKCMVDWMEYLSTREIIRIKKAEEASRAAGHRKP